MANNFFFTRAERKQAFLKIALIGPSGSGKSLGALLLAQGLESRVAVIDTEARRSEYYADRFAFDVLHLDAPYKPERYIEAVNAAISAGYETIIIDSASHEWIGTGGCLEIVDSMKGGGNSFSAWGKVTPRHNNFIDIIVQAPAHVILTLRGKDEYVVEDVNGKKVPRKIGIGAQMRDGLEYECTVSLLIDQQSHTYSVAKDNTGIFDGRVGMLCAADGQKLLEWARSGSAPAQATAPPLPSPSISTPPPKGSGHANTLGTPHSGFNFGQQVVTDNGEIGTIRAFRPGKVGLEYEDHHKGWEDVSVVHLFSPPNDAFPDDLNGPDDIPDEPAEPPATKPANNGRYEGRKTRVF